MHYYSVIYDAIDQVKNAVNGLLAPEISEQIIGLAQVKDVFRSSKLGAIAGCIVVDGVAGNSPVVAGWIAVVAVDVEVREITAAHVNLNPVVC